MRLLLIVPCLSLWLPLQAHAEPGAIVISYSEDVDARCAQQRGYEIKPEWVGELQSRLPEFKSLWQSISPPMLSAVASITGKTIEAPAAIRLTLCDTPSQSMGEPSVNMRYALRAFAPQPVAMRYKADTAFHEVLHGFVSRHTPGTSALLQAHRGESACVRNHLHLLALQKAVLLSLGAAQELEQVVTVDSQLPSGCYKKAWQLVNETDAGYKLYVSELASGP